MLRTLMLGAATVVGPTARLAATKSWRILGLGLLRRRLADLGLGSRSNLLRSRSRNLLREAIGKSARI